MNYKGLIDAASRMSSIRKTDTLRAVAKYIASVNALLDYEDITTLYNISKYDNLDRAGERAIIQMMASAKCDAQGVRMLTDMAENNSTFGDDIAAALLAMSKRDGVDMSAIVTLATGISNNIYPHLSCTDMSDVAELIAMGMTPPLARKIFESIIDTYHSKSGRYDHAIRLLVALSKHSVNGPAYLKRVWEDIRERDQEEGGLENAMAFAGIISDCRDTDHLEPMKTAMAHVYFGSEYQNVDGSIPVLNYCSVNLINSAAADGLMHRILRSRKLWPVAWQVALQHLAERGTLNLESSVVRSHVKAGPDTRRVWWTLASMKLPNKIPLSYLFEKLAEFGPHHESRSSILMAIRNTGQVLTSGQVCILIDSLSSSTSRSNDNLVIQILSRTKQGLHHLGCMLQAGNGDEACILKAMLDTGDRGTVEGVILDVIRQRWYSTDKVHEICELLPDDGLPELVRELLAELDLETPFVAERSRFIRRTLYTISPEAMSGRDDDGMEYSRKLTSEVALHLVGKSLSGCLESKEWMVSIYNMDNDHSTGHALVKAYLEAQLDFVPSGGVTAACSATNTGSGIAGAKLIDTGHTTPNERLSGLISCLCVDTKD